MAGFTGFGGSGSVSGLQSAVGGFNPTPTRQKTVYNLMGQPVEVDESVPTTNYDPNVGYAGTHYFNTPPPTAPQPRIAEASAQQMEGNVAQTAAQTQAMTPSVAGLVSNTAGSPLTQGAYEGQAQTQLEANLAQRAAAGDLDAQKQLLEYRARLNNEAFTQRAGALGVTGDAPNQSGGAPTTYAPTFNEEAARAAAFGRAKDQAGKTALASLQALQDVMAGRGLRGSSIESNETADILGGGAGEINDFTRDQLMLDLNRAGDISDRESSAALTRRGQDLSYKQSLLGLLNASGSLY